MARFIKEPAQGDDSRKLWRTVEECKEALNALMNMTGVIEGEVRMIGKLEVGNGSSVFRFNENTEVGSLGT